MLSIKSIATLLLLSVFALAAPLENEARSVSEIFYVYYNGQYLNNLNSYNGQNYSVLNDPHQGTYFGAAVYLNNSALYFAAGGGKGYPVIVPQERANWHTGLAGEVGTKGFRKNKGFVKFLNNTIYGCYTEYLAPYPVFTLAYAADPSGVPTSGNCSVVKLTMFNKGS